MLAHQRAEQRLAVAVERRGRLVEQPERTRREEQPREPGAPPLAGGEDADRQGRARGRGRRSRRPRRNRRRASPDLLPIERRPEAQRLAQGQRRLQRIGVAEIVRDGFVLARGLRSAAFRPAAGSRPARSRSRLDLPAPFGPVTASSWPRSERERRRRRRRAARRARRRGRALRRQAAAKAAGGISCRSRT